MLFALTEQNVYNYHKHNFQFTSVCCRLGSFITGITCSTFSSYHHIGIIYFSIVHPNHYFLLEYLDVGVEVFVALIMMVTVFWVVLPYSLLRTSSSIIRVTGYMLMTEATVDTSTIVTEAVGSLHLYTTTS